MIEIIGCVNGTRERTALVTCTDWPAAIDGTSKSSNNVDPFIVRTFEGPADPMPWFFTVTVIQGAS